MTDNPHQHSGEPHQRRPWQYGLPAVLLLSLVVRGGVLVLMPDALTDDPDDYRGLAENLVRHGSFQTESTPPAYRPPLYPLMLAPCVALDQAGRAAIGALHLALGLATVWLVFVLAGRWGLDRPAAALAAVLVACDPILLAQSTQVMTETPATLLTALALIALSSAGRRPSIRRAALAGGCLGLAMLCRPGLLPWAVAAVAALPALAGSWPMRLKIFAAAAVAVLVVLSPWAIRNQLRLGHPVVSTTHGGYTLLLGNNPEFYEHLRTASWGSVWKAQGLSETWRNRALADELAASRQAYAEAWGNIRREPATFLYSCLVRVGRLWNPLPHQLTASEGPLRRSARYAVALWYLAELPLAAVGAWIMAGRRRRREWFWGLLLVATLTAVHTLYWTDMRMRAPLMPVVAVAAAAGLATVGKARGGGRL